MSYERKISPRAENFVSAHESILNVMKKNDRFLSLLGYLGLGGIDEDLATLSEIVKKIPDENLRWDVLDWMTEKILLPEDPLVMAHVQKYIVMMLTVISTNDYLHGVPSFLNEEEILNGPYRDRALLISKSYAFLFFMDDRFGNENYSQLQDHEKREVKASTKRIAAYLNGMYTRQPVSTEADGILVMQLHRAERAFYELVDEFKEKLPDTPEALAWWEEFKVRMIDHLKLGNDDLNKNYTVKTYAKDRQAASGMNWAAIMGEFLYFKFIPRHKLETNPDLADFDQLLTKTEQLYKRGGGEINDDFSFVKEVIDKGSAVNIMVVVFNKIIEEKRADTYSKEEVRELVRFLYTIADQELVEVLAHTFFDILAQEGVDDDEPLVTEHFLEITYLETIKRNSELRTKLLVDFFTNQETLSEMLEEKYQQGILTEDEYQALKFKLADWLIGILATIVWQLTEGYPRYENEAAIFQVLRPDDKKRASVLKMLGFHNQKRYQSAHHSLSPT
ncbi:MAG TPA: hypothetical protein VF209_02040 [Patescibacteria group bacterium]